MKRPYQVIKPHLLRTFSDGVKAFNLFVADSPDGNTATLRYEKRLIATRVEGGGPGAVFRLEGLRLFLSLAVKADMTVLIEEIKKERNWKLYMVRVFSQGDQLW